MSNTISNAIKVCVVILAIIIFVFTLTYTTYEYENSLHQIDEYVIEGTITNMSYGEEATGRASSHPVYNMGVKNDDGFAETLQVTSQDYAKYQQGDKVQIKVVVSAYRDGVKVYEYFIENS